MTRPEMQARRDALRQELRELRKTWVDIALPASARPPVARRIAAAWIELNDMDAAIGAARGSE